MKQFLYLIILLGLISKSGFAAESEKNLNIAELEKRLPEITRGYFDNIKKYVQQKSPEDAKYLTEEFYNDFSRRVNANWPAEKIQLKSISVSKFRERLIKDANYLLATQLYEYKNGVKNNNSGYTVRNKKSMELTYTRMASSNSNRTAPTTINNSSTQPATNFQVQSSSDETGRVISKPGGTESKRWIIPFVLIAFFGLLAIIYFKKKQ